MLTILFFSLVFAGTIQEDCGKEREQLCGEQKSRHAITLCLHTGLDQNLLSKPCVVHLQKHSMCIEEMRGLLQSKCPQLIRAHAESWSRQSQALVACGIDSASIPLSCENIVNTSWSNTQPIATPGSGGVFVDELKQTGYFVGYGILGKQGQLGYEALSATAGKRHFSHALSMHPPWKGSAWAEFEIGGDWRLFCGWASIADSASPRGELFFEVVGDGKVLWTSEALRKPGASVPVRVNVTAVRTLKLQTRAAASNSCAHTFWGTPSLQRDSCPK